MRINTERLIEEDSYCETVFSQFLKKKVVKPHSSALFEKHLQKSLDNLEFANFLFSEHNFSIKEKLPSKTYYDWCVTIYYYSLYHAALALATKAGYVSKNHLATITTITLFYYHKKTLLEKEDLQFIVETLDLDSKDIELIVDSKSLRQRASYGVGMTFQRQQALTLQKDTAEFINRVRIIFQ